MNDYFIYLRKSREDAELEKLEPGGTLKRHKKILMDIAKKQGLRVERIFEEIRSGETIAARPVMQEVLREVEAGTWAGCLVMEVERLARGDTIDQGIMMQAFKYSGTKIVTPYKTYDPTNESDEEYFEFGLFMSRREYKTINKRLQSGRLASVKEGKYLGNTPPYGYDRVRLEHQKGYTLLPNEQAVVVKSIFAWRAQGIPGENGTKACSGPTRIAKHLTQLGIPAPNGGIWSPQTIDTILRNPVYLGKNKWGQRKTVKTVRNGEVTVSRPRSQAYHLYEGLWPALVAPSLYEQAQTKAREHALPVPSQKALANPLAGLIYCAKCGRAMVRRPYQNGAAPTLICTATGCDNVSAALPLVEERLLRAVASWLKDFKLAYSAAPVPPSAPMEEELIKKAQKELRKLEEQERKAYDLLEQGVYTTEVFLERSTVLKRRISQQRAALDQARATLERQSQSIQPLPRSIPNARTVLESYQSLQAAQDKNDLLRQVIEKVEYKRDSGGRWNEAHDNFELIIYPKFN